MKKLWIGIPLIMLVFGIMLTGCDEGLGGEDELIGKWYTTQAAADAGTGTVACEFTSDGKLILNGNTRQAFTYSVLNGDTLTVSMNNKEVGNTKFSITGTLLELTTMCSPFSAKKYYKAGSNDVSEGDIKVNFDDLTANGSSSQTTTQLFLTFDSEITGLSANDITLSGVSGVNKGTLSGSNPYTLPISGFTSSGTLTVAVSKTSYEITGSPKSVTINYSSGSVEKGTFYIKSFAYAATDSYFGALTTQGQYTHISLTDSSFAWELENNFNDKPPTEYTEAQLVEYLKTLTLTQEKAEQEADWLFSIRHGYFGVRSTPTAILTILK
jgi:hypothetical protein